MGPEDRRPPSAAPWLPPHHPKGASPTVPLLFVHSLSCLFDAVMLLFVYRLSQIVNEIRDDLAEFKCGMAHLFCM
jgi:hypothetical protein